MKLKFVVKDIAYMRALARAIEKADINVSVEIGRDFAQKENVLIVSDIPYADYGSSAGGKYKGIVFLDDQSDPVSSEISENGPFRLYKYSPVQELLAEIRMFYFIWTGSDITHRSDSRIISVQCDGDTRICTDYCELFARHYAYRTGKEILVLGLSYIDPGAGSPDRGDPFKRLVYMIQRNQVAPARAFFHRDQYGVSHLRTSSGINPLAELDGALFDQILNYVTDHLFDIVILDIGAVFTERNRKLINRAEYRYWLYTRNPDLLQSRRLIGQLFDHPETVNRIYVGKGLDHLSMTIEDRVRVIEGVSESDKGSR